MYLDTYDKFSFNINVSTGAYPNQKPEKPWQIQYATQKITIRQLDRLQREGKSFCYNFKGRDASGLITQHEKTLSGFDYTNIIFFDIDKMPVSMGDYVENLPYQPSLCYTTISNGKDGKYGYRLIYAFDSPITSIEDFDNLYYSIAAANGFKKQVAPDGTPFEFDYRKVNQQYYGGGTHSLSSVSNKVYSISDFSHYQDKGLELKEVLTGGKSTKKKVKNDKESSPFENNIGKATKEHAYYSDLDNPFYMDLYTLSPKDFLSKYEMDYRNTYLNAIKTPLTLSEDGSYWIYPDDYQEIKRHWTKDKDGKRCIKKWEIGSGRKKRLYISAQIMRHNVPDITKEQLVYNLIYERYHYYINKDNKLNNNIIVSIAETALGGKYPLSPCKHPAFSINKDYWLRANISSNQAKNIVRKVLREQQVLSLYDFNLSVKDNIKVLSDNGIKVGRSYLFNLVKKYKDSPNENNIGKGTREHAYCSQMDK